LLKLEIDDNSNEKFLVININSDGSKIARLIINISIENIDFNLIDSSYNISKKIVE